MRTDLRLLRGGCAGVVAILFAACQREALEIHVDAPKDAQVAIPIRDARGVLVRTLAPGNSERVLKWDARDAAGQPVPNGEYFATIVTHRGFGARLCGAIAGTGLPPTPRGPPIPGEYGAPISVVADDQRVYLAWTGGRIAACELDGRIAWSITLPRRAECAALAIDGGQLFALARSRPPWRAQDALVRLRTADGEIAPWTRGTVAAVTLPIPSLWPADSADQPTHAGALAARAGHVYLAFPELHFLAVLRADSGEYLQTIIGPTPTALDLIATRTASPGDPGAAMDADFAVVALGGSALGRVLFAHDPLWVIASDTWRLDEGERISALTLLGDAAPHHPRSFFVGLGAPLFQVQRRDILGAEGYVWLAGDSGGRAAHGPWQPETLGPVRALALDARGELWVAEGEAVPPRFSVWSTAGKQGRLLHEFFGPIDAEEQGVALLPGRPDILIGGACEWQLDAQGSPHCLGVITREGLRAASFPHGGTRLRSADRDGNIRWFARHGDGDYRQLSEAAATDSASAKMVDATPGGPVVIEAAGSLGWRIATADGAPLGVAALPADFPHQNARLSEVVQAPDGRIFGATLGGGLARFEITGLDEMRSTPALRLRVAASR